MVRDRGGKPVADAQVSLFTKDTRTETAANGQGEFKLETPAGKPFCVVVRPADFRVNGSYYDKNPSNLNQTMIRLTEPAEKLALRPILAKEEREKILKRLFEPFKQKLVKSTDTQEKVMALQSLTGVAPDFVTEFLEKNPLQPAPDNEMLLTQVAMKRVSQNPEEAEELIGRMNQGRRNPWRMASSLTRCPRRRRAKAGDPRRGAGRGKGREVAGVSRRSTWASRETVIYARREGPRHDPFARGGENRRTACQRAAFAGFARGSFATDLCASTCPRPWP